MRRLYRRFSTTCSACRPRSRDSGKGHHVMDDNHSRDGWKEEMRRRRLHCHCCSSSRSGSTPVSGYGWPGAEATAQGAQSNRSTGDLVWVRIPEERDVAIRDLTWAREDALKARLKARQQLRALLLRYGHRYTGESSPAPTLRWPSLRRPARASFDGGRSGSQ